MGHPLLCVLGLCTQWVGEVILGEEGGGGVSAAGLCLVDRGGEEVVPLRPRCFRKAEDVSFHCTLSCFTPEPQQLINWLSPRTILIID